MSFVGSQVMDEGSQSSLSHLITGEGIFNTAACEKLAEEVGLAKCGNSYAIISIMGPQSGGKSTLLNHLFQTNFKAMDADEGRSQTTQGIWIAQCAGIEPCTLVMDLEGSDGRERGEENNTSFEKQIALFALAVSDVVLINMWCHDIGRDHGGNRPLLKIVFEVMLKFFNPHKTTLMFVIRDKTRTPLEKLDLNLRSDIQQIWDSIQKPDAHKETPLCNFFNVEVVALCSFEREEVEFKQQVAGLRRRFFNSKSPGGLAGDREGVVPGTAFSLSAKEMWESIKKNKDLNLPSHKVMMATVRCEEIANEIFDSFGRNEDWRQLKESVKTRAVSDFGERLRSIYDSCLTEYDMETTYFDSCVTLAKRKDLEAKIIILVDPSFRLMVAHILSETLDEFKKVFENTLKHGNGFSDTARFCTDSIMAKFDSRCADASFHQVNWLESRNDFQRRIDAHISEIRAGKLIKLNASYEKKLSDTLSEQVGNLLSEAGNGTWPTIRPLVHRDTVSAVSHMSAELASFEMDAQYIGNMISNLENYARDVVISKTRDEAGKVLIFMKDRFSSIFIHQSDTVTDIHQLKQTARSESLKILVAVAAVPMDVREDNIMNQFTTLSDEIFSASHRWEQIPLSHTLITPKQCQQYWKHFCLDTDVIVTQATDRQVARTSRPDDPLEYAIVTQATNNQDAGTSRPDGPVESIMRGVGQAADLVFGFAQLGKAMGFGR